MGEGQRGAADRLEKGCAENPRQGGSRLQQAPVDHHAGKSGAPVMHFTVIKNALVPADNEARKLVEPPLGRGVEVLLTSKEHRRAYAAFTRYGKARGISARAARDYLAIVCGHLQLVSDRDGRPVVVPVSVSDMGVADFEVFWEAAREEMLASADKLPAEHADELRKLLGEE